MDEFRILVNGKNFLLKVDNQQEKMGFYVTRFVQAQNSEEAELIVIDLIREELSQKIDLLNDSNDHPMLYVEEIEERLGNESSDTGFSWYKED